ncbi:MAG: helicase-related protein [Gaiellaceae bacterium]
MSVENGLAARYAIGQRVALRVDRSRAGVVVAVLPTGGTQRYRVFHGPDEREYDGDQLVADTADEGDALLEALAEGRFVLPQEFRARLTAARLAHPSVDDLYAMRAARILHVPFQYKPLLRLLRADQPRLLIADDVGVGKTIEAGLILKELEARGEVERVLVMCPRALAQKWRAEMRRFDEDFRILDGRALRHCLREAELDGWPSEAARAILPMELIQRQDYLQGDERRPGLLTLELPPQFDLLIIDEAHHLRNVATGRYSAAEFLATVSDAALLLSATPVHTGAANLFTLLQLLRPDLFPSFETFERMVEPNRHLTEAMRLVRADGADGHWQQAAAEALDRAAATRWGEEALVHNVQFASWRTRLAAETLLDDEERIRCLRELEEAHTLALVMNRTRRRDIGRFTQREPRTVEVPFTPDQQAFYDRLVAWQRRVLDFVHGPLVANLVLSQIERQAASCLFGVGDNLAEIARTGFVVRRLSEDDEDDGTDSEEVPLPDALVEEAASLLEQLRDLPRDDPKLDALLGVVREALDDSAGAGKLLVFTFFRRTIRYLEENLREHDVRLAVVHGDIDDDERQELRARFRLDRHEPPAVDVLLSTEVGAEGLDYEFCDRLVNYDIPWNPMRVEQRIGRIDRFGQRSPKVLVFNFVTPGTVEERVFMRCYERLGIFRDTVGDLEEVLGETVQALNRLAADPRLTPGQLAERVQQEADNVLRRAEEQRRLEAETPGLLGLDAALEDEARDIDGRGRFVTADEIRDVVEGFLQGGLGGASLSPNSADRTKRTMELRLAQSAQREELRRRLLPLPRSDRSVNELRRALGAGASITLTFDQEAALEQRDVAFITPVHALSRVACQYWRDKRNPLVAQLATTDQAIAPGRYLFAFERWEELAGRPAVHLVGIAVRLEDGADAPGVAERLVEMVRTADAVPKAAPVPVPVEARQALDRQAHWRRREAIGKLQTTNAALIDQRLASLDLYYRGLLAQLDSVLAASSDPRIARMKTSERERREAEHASRRQDLERRRDADIVAERIAVGVLEVQRGE